MHDGGGRYSKQCTALRNYIVYCRKRFGVHTLRCNIGGATACNSDTAYRIVSKKLYRQGIKRVCGAAVLPPVLLKLHSSLHLSAGLSGTHAPLAA